MFISQLKNSLFLFILIFLASCKFFVPVEPIADVNDRFNASYGKLVKKAKRKNKESLKKNPYDGTIDFDKTAYGRLLKSEADFIEINARNNPYIVVSRSGPDNMEYLSANYGKYQENEDNIFDEIIIPKNDFKYYNLGRKQYNEISNIELQESYDYIVEINKERLKQIEIARLKQEALLREQEKNQSLRDRTRKGLQNLTKKIQELIGLGK